MTPSPFDRVREAFRSERRKSFKPQPRLNVPQWADNYRYLSTAVGSTGGPWRTSRVEVARGPMMAVTEPGVQIITAKTSTQILKTSLLENVIGFFCHQDPAPMLLTQPKEGSVKAFSKERLQPMAQTTPVLRSLLSGEGKNDTLQYREFPGGFLAMESAGSPTNLAMRAIRVTLADEIDKYEPTKEGDPLILLEERAATFMTRRLHLRCCSPTKADTSRITKSYEESDQRRPYVPCPHCAHEFVLDFFKHVNWSKSEDGKQHFPFTAAIYCPDCGAEWSEVDRLRLLTTTHSIKWRQTRRFICCPDKQPDSNKDKRQDPDKERLWHWDDKNQVGRALCKHCGKQAVPNEHAGFNCGKLYSPFITVPQLADKWIMSKDDPETKQVFYNAIDVRTPMLTLGGWRTMGAVAVGDVVFDERGQPANVIGASEVYTGRPCYEVKFQCGAVIVADEDHLWTVRDNGGSSSPVSSHKTRTLKTSELAVTYVGQRGRNRYFVSVTEPLNRREAQLPVDPYVFGLWIGDGEQARGRIAAGGQDWQETSQHVGPCRVTEPDVNGVRYIFPGQDSEETQYPGKPNAFARALDSLDVFGGMGFKHLPRSYLDASVAQRWELLRGLLDSDGHATDGSVRFSTTSDRLRDDAVELIRSLGFKTKVAVCKQGGNGTTLNGYPLKATTLFQVYFTPHGMTPFFKLSRKQAIVDACRDKGVPSRVKSRAITSIKRVPSRPVRCIMVDSPSHLYLCGRELVPTHNTQLGLEYHQETIKQFDDNALLSRAEVYAADVPAGAVVLTMGIDVQTSGYLVGEVVAWGEGEESWSIDTPTFAGDPGRPEVWWALDAYLQRKFSLEGGGKLIISAACIDSGGHFTEEAYKFARGRVHRNVWAIKGANDRPGQKSPVWPIPKLDARKTRLTGYKPVILGTGAAKESIYQRLALTEPGPGYCHFPAERHEVIEGIPTVKYGEPWFDQLTAEKQVLEKKNGYSFTRWILPKGRANEALDTRVYAYAALQGLYAVRKFSMRIALSRMETELSRRSAPEVTAEVAAQMDEVMQPAASPETPPAPPPRPAPIRKQRRAYVSRSSFMG